MRKMLRCVMTRHWYARCFPPKGRVGARCLQRDVRNIANWVSLSRADRQPVTTRHASVGGRLGRFVITLLLALLQNAGDRRVGGKNTNRVTPLSKDFMAVEVHMLEAPKLICVAAFIVTSCASTPAGPLAPLGVRNFVDVNGKLSRGAQPTSAGIEALADRHFITIVNLRSRAEDAVAFDDEQLAANRLNVQLISVPLSNWFAPSMCDVEHIMLTLNGSSTPVFVHCQRGADRTGTIIAAYRIVHDCWSAAQAICEAREHAMGWWQFPMRRFIRRWYEAKHVESCVPTP